MDSRSTSSDIDTRLPSSPSSTRSLRSESRSSPRQSVKRKIEIERDTTLVVASTSKKIKLDDYRNRRATRSRTKSPCGKKIKSEPKPKMTPPKPTQMKLSIPLTSSTQTKRKITPPKPTPSSTQTNLSKPPSSSTQTKPKVTPSKPTPSSTQTKLSKPPPSSTQTKLSKLPPSSKQIKQKITPPKPTPSSTQANPKITPPKPTPSSTQIKPSKPPKTETPISEPTKTETKPFIKKHYDDILNQNFAHEFLAEKESLDVPIAKNLINLFDTDNTLPFIARYRRNLTNDMSPEQLRHAKESYEEMKVLKTKITTVLNAIDKSGKLTTDLKRCILNCKNTSELDHLYGPFKAASKTTLYNRAKQLGLEPSALAILYGNGNVHPAALVQENGPDGVRTVADVEKGFMHIIAHTIATDADVITFLRKLKQQLQIYIETKKSVAPKDVNENEIKKFEQYFEFKKPINFIAPHQFLAINRAESRKILKVSIIFDTYAFERYKLFCTHKFLHGTNITAYREHIFMEALKDGYKRLVVPLIQRQTKAELKVLAEKASIDIFTKNLKKLLLTVPVKGKPIFGIDPGFKLGCKCAVISPLGTVLETNVVYPHTRNNLDEDKAIIRNLLTKYNCNLIALGNGSACRETEQWLTELIESNYFQPIDVTYTIVNECGASIYSCSEEARKEFPKMDELLISAVSLARRVLDPLAELVKVEPKHLGVGMYQQDLNKKQLETALEEVVSECVSFVGVDINTASLSLLKRVAGLTTGRAESIIKFRNTKGPFTNRYQLKDIKGIGDKVFIQCAGFLRVGPLNANDAKEFYTRPDTMPLDCTWIHPESYSLAEKILLKFKLNYKSIGQPKFISHFNHELKKSSIEELAKEFISSESTIKLLIDVLSRPLDHDVRQENPQKIFFKKGVTSANDIRLNMQLTGRVQNVTDFGAFVDLGVGVNGLIHTSKMAGAIIELGDVVEVEVINYCIERKRIGLSFMRKL